MTTGQTVFSWISCRSTTKIRAINSAFKKYIYLLPLSPVGKKSCFRTQPKRSCPLQQISFLDWFPIAKSAVFYIVGLLRCFNILVTFLAVVFPHSSWLENQLFYGKTCAKYTSMFDPLWTFFIILSFFYRLYWRFLIFFCNFLSNYFFVWN